MDPRRELELRRRMASGDTRAELELRREMAQTEKSVADDVGPLQAGLISAGRGFVELGRGAKELFGGKVKRDTVEEEAYRKLREKYPLVTAIGEGAPFIAAGGAVGATGRGLGLAANMARQARIGGALGLTMPGTPEERVARGATEAALGAGGEALGRAVTLIPGLGGLGMREVRDPVTRRIINRGRDLGFVVLPSSHVQGRLTRQVIEGGISPACSRLLRRTIRDLDRDSRQAAPHGLCGIGKSLPVSGSWRKRVGIEPPQCRWMEWMVRTG